MEGPSRRGLWSGVAGSRVLYRLLNKSFGQVQRGQTHWGSFEAASQRCEVPPYSLATRDNTILISLFMATFLSPHSRPWYIFETALAD